MNLSFSEFFPWETKTFFVEKIKAGVKRHTIRGIKIDAYTSPRWTPGTPIHFWEGSVRSGKGMRFNVESLDQAAYWMVKHQFKKSKYIVYSKQELSDRMDLVEISSKIDIEDPHGFALPAISATEIIRIHYRQLKAYTYKVTISVGEKSAILEWYRGPQLEDTIKDLETVRISHDDIGVLALSENDGFDSIHWFLEWFFKAMNHENSYLGQILHWQDPSKSVYDLNSAKIFNYGQAKR